MNLNSCERWIAFFESPENLFFFTNDRVVFGLINQYQMYCDKVNSVDE